MMTTMLQLEDLWIGAWWLFTTARAHWRLCVVLIAIYSAWSFAKRVKRRVKVKKEMEAEEKRRRQSVEVMNVDADGEMNNNNNTINNYYKTKTTATGQRAANHVAESSNTQDVATTATVIRRRRRRWSRDADDALFVMMCDKSTQWEDAMELLEGIGDDHNQQLSQKVEGEEEQKKKLKEDRTTKERFTAVNAARGRSAFGGGRAEAGEGGEGGLTAMKIKQLMANSNSSGTTNSNNNNNNMKNSLINNATAKKGSNVRAAPIANGINGHVNDLKMRFEDPEGVTAAAREQRHFQRTVDSVALMKRFAKRVEEEVVKSQKATEEGNKRGDMTKDEDRLVDLSPTVVLRRNRLMDRNGSLEVINGIGGGGEGVKGQETTHLLHHEFGGSVHSLEEILNQQRFSRSLSQYSVSELFRNESPAEISRDCERFDELFSRSTDDLTRHGETGGVGDESVAVVSKFGSMVDVVNV